MTTPDTAPTGDQDRITDSAATDVDDTASFDICDCPNCKSIGEVRAGVQHDCATSGHLYDDDWPWPDQADIRALAPGSRVGDPCIWCDHNKGADE